MLKQRNNTFDMVKGIGILLVIIGHQMHGYGQLIPMIYTFHMPLFFIVSGYFFKGKGFLNLLKRDAKTLLLPYIMISAAQIIYGISIAALQYAPEKAEYWINALWKDFGPLWFLLAMFWCRMFYNLLFSGVKKFSSRPVIYTAAISCLVFVITISTPPYMQSIDYQCIIIGASAMFYFSLGHLAKEYGGMVKIPDNPIVTGLALLICGISIYLSIGCEFRAFKQNVFSVIAPVTATFLIYRICKKLNSGNNNFLTWYGKLSIVVFSFHTLMHRLLPTDRFFALVLDTSNLLIISLMCTIFHIIVTIMFCKISERSKVLRFLFNIKS